MLSQLNAPLAHGVAHPAIATLPRPKRQTEEGKHARRAARVAKIRDLIDVLRTRELRRDEIGPVINLGPSGCRKYIKDLRENGVAELARFEGGTATHMGHPVYRLTDDSTRVEKFLRDMPIATEVTPARVGAPTQLEIAARNPGRHFHVMVDDEYYAIRVSRTPAMRDPLVAAFFGAARSALVAQDAA